MSTDQNPDDITAVDAVHIARQATRRVNDLEDEIERYEDELAARDQRIAALEERLDAVESSTELIQHVEDASRLDVDERAAVCLQTLVNEARSRPDNQPSRASMDWEKGLAALGGGIDRTRIYDVYRRAEELVGNDDVCWYEKEPRGSQQNSRLVVDLDGTATGLGFLPDGDGR